MFNKHHWGAKKIVDMKTIEAKTPNGPAQYTVYIVDNHKYGMWTPFKGEKPVGEPLVFKESQDGISASDLAEILYNRLEMRYPDIVTRYGHEVVGDAVMDVADFHAGAEELGTSDVGIMIRQILKKLENYNVDESKEVDYDDPKWDAMVNRVGQLAKQGERKTVYDPIKRVYKTVPVNPPKDKGVAEAFGPLPRDNQQIRLGRHTINIERVGEDKDFIGFAWHDSKGQDHYEEVSVGDLGSYDDLIDRIKQEISYQERQYTDQGVAEGEYKSRHIHRQEQNKKYDEYRRNQEAQGKKSLSRGDWAATQRKGQQGVEEEKCPHCSGPMFSELMINEKKDACYYKVKSRYKVWPSAYASGALVKCRKKGASNWGTGGKSNESIEDLDENLRKWFKEKWVRFGPDGKIKGDCARGDDSEGKPKCLPQSKAHSLGKKGRASAAARKRRKDPNPERSGKAINVNTKKKSNEGVAEEFELAGVGVAYELGRKAYKQGMTIRDNPYSATKEARKYDEWEKGLQRGKWDAIEARKFRNRFNESELKDKKDLDAKRKALQDMEREPGHDKEAIRQRKLDLEKEARSKGIKESAILKGLLG
jgi:hypothetical protein